MLHARINPDWFTNFVSGAKVEDAAERAGPLRA